MMNDLPHSPSDLSRIYAQRFAVNRDYRRKVWRILIDDYFSQFISSSASVLDLGCGYGEFINGIHAARRFAMDLNQDAAKLLDSDVEFLCQDCSQPWPLAENSLDVVFTSNFFEHLPDKRTLGSTLDQAKRALKPGGKLIAMGPNIKHVPVPTGIFGTTIYRLQNCRWVRLSKIEAWGWSAPSPNFFLTPWREVHSRHHGLLVFICGCPSCGRFSDANSLSWPLSRLREHS